MMYQNSSDRGFTGHRSHDIGGNDLGLVYMGARFYVSGIGRFVSADTIVPDPTNPQNYNRFTYAGNSPINRIDPTGHVDIDDSSGDYTCYNTLDCQSKATLELCCFYPDHFEHGGYLIGTQPDAVGVGISVSGGVSIPGISLNINTGIEVLRHRETGEIALFFAPGGGASLGIEDFTSGWRQILINEHPNTKAADIDLKAPFSINSAITGISVWNVDNLATDYSGLFDSQALTGVTPYGGFSQGGAAVPGELMLVENERKEAYSKTFSFIPVPFNLGLSSDTGTNYYVPVYSYTPGGGSANIDYSYHANAFWSWLR